MTTKKEQISAAALKIFAHNGYSTTTMDTIAETANVAKGTLYYHFKTKEELFVHVNKQGVQMLIESVKKTMHDESLSLENRLISVLEAHLQFFSEHQEFCLLLLTITSGDQERDTIIRELLSDYFATIENYFAELQQEGLINPALDIQTLTSALFGMVGFTVLRRYFRNEPLYSEEVKQTLITMGRNILKLPNNI